MKKSIVSNIIFTLLLITIAIMFGMVAITFLEKNANFIKKYKFENYFDVDAKADQFVQDPDYFYFYLLSNSKTTILVRFKDLTTNKIVEKNYTVDGFKEVNESLSYLFSSSASQLDNHQIAVLIKNVQSKEPFKYAFTVLLKEAKKIFIVFTNIPSYLVIDRTVYLLPPKQVFYVYNNVNVIEWFDPYVYGSASLGNNKLYEVYAYEDFNTNDFTYTFLDSYTGNPIIGAKVYVNSFFIGYTDNQGRIKIKYHRFFDGYLKLEHKCYHYDNKEYFYSNRFIYLDNEC